MHRVVHAYVDLTDNGRLSTGGKKRRALTRQMLDDPRTLDDTKLLELGRHASEREVAADHAEKDLRTFLVLQLLKEKNLGDELDGTVTGIMPNGTIFVSIDRYLVDGAIKSRDMKGGDGRVNSPKTTNTLCLALTMSGLSRGEFLIASRPCAMMMRCPLRKPKPPQ